MSSKQKPTPEERAFLLKIQDAVALYENGDIESASQLYEALLQQKPDHYLALGLFGALQCKHGDPGWGERLLRKSIESRPTHWAAHLNLGNVLVLRNKLQDAQAQYELALKYKPDSLDTLLNLGALALHNNKIPDAAGYYHKAYEVAGNHAKVVRGIACVFESDGQHDRAVNYYEQLIKQDPGKLSYLREYAALLSRCGKTEHEVTVYRQILTLNPEDAQARHMLAALSGVNAPDKAATAYVSELFDEFAASFDDVLKSLEYKAPEMVGVKAGQRCADQTFDNVLDAGCGTGLCGSYLRPLAVNLTGIDLSAGMLQRARYLKIYDHLLRAEIVEYLTHEECSFDLIVCADTLCYFGELHEFFMRSYNALTQSGELVFTVELLTIDKSYRLEIHGRYSHSEAYIRRTLADHELELQELETVVLRMENQQPVRGLLVVASKL